MKKAVILPLLLMLIQMSSFAQRFTDLKVSLMAPETNDTIMINDPFLIKARVYNNGVDTIWANDSLRLTLMFDNNKILFFVDSVTVVDYIALDGYEIHPGDSTDIGFTFGVGTGWNTGATELCVIVVPANGADSVVDTAITDNKSCANMVIIEDPTSVNKIKSDAQNVMVYPNPANKDAHFSFTLGKPSVVSIQVMDMMGRVVYQSNIPQLQTGKHNIPVNVAELPGGTYLYKISTDAGQSTGRLQVE